MGKEKTTQKYGEQESMKNIKKMIASLLLACLGFSALPASAQKDNVPPVPIVPMDVLVKGRQGVVSHLMFGVEYVGLEVHGRSVVTPPWRGIQRFYMEELNAMGYIHRGSSIELGDALASRGYALDVIPTPEGGYDVQVDVYYFLADGSIAMRGYGYLNIYRLPGGGLAVGEFHPWMYFDGQVGFRYSGCFGAANWIPANYGGTISLGAYNIDENEWLLTLPGNALGNGYLAIADCDGNVTSWDLEHEGNIMSGDWIIAMLGMVRSNDIHPIRNGPLEMAPDMSFYRRDGRLFGRPQLIEFNTAGITNEVVLSVPVWGSSRRVTPSQVFLTPIVINERGGGRLEVGREYQVPQRVTIPGELTPFWFQIEAGLYHIRTVFPDVEDFDSIGIGGGYGRATPAVISNK